ncbi:PAS domain S-box protein [Sphingomonas sp. IC-56]|uniref:PAS domain-containing sensor histidine kinase n=1 Tax=Sphingomonas sp. IC-56 TaxID=2898529 RepID=UPI001E2A3B1C|nr:PAS domain S-box protein [Sphingomonas sp. IC-56]MCD2325106.1 PAS domain S-box protein [Sphingomonas sp. IC-56]
MSNELLGEGVRSRTATYIAAALVFASLLTTLISLSGWIFDIAQLRDFGGGRPVWPLGAIAFGFVSVGLLLAIFNRPRLACCCWAVTAAIAGAAIVDATTSLDLGLRDVLFPTLVHKYGYFSRTAPSASIGPTLLLLFAGIGVGIVARRRLPPEAGSLLAGASLGMALATGLLVWLAIAGWGKARLSVPTMVVGYFLSIALIVLHSGVGWIRTLSRPGPERQALRLLIPAVSVLPVAPSVVELVVMQLGLLHPFATQLLVVGCNIVIVALVTYWAVNRVAREQGASTELTQALDATTVVLAEPDGTITHWSRGCQRLFGWTEAEARGQNRYVLLRSACALGTPETDPSVREMLEVCKDGRQIHAIERVLRIEQAGRPPCIVHSLTDITQHVAATEALRASEERLALATAVHGVSVFEGDYATGQIAWSPGAEERLGLQRGSLDTLDMWREQIVPGDLADARENHLRALREHADKVSFRHRLLQRDGGERVVEGSFRLFYDVAGKPLRSIGVVVDVTERDERETALRSREAQLRSVLETVPDAMIVVDECGVVRQFSTTAEKLWGYRADEVIGKPETMLLPEHLREVHQAVLRRFLQHGEGAIGEINVSTAQAADGRRFPIEIRTGVARIDEQFLLTMFVRDISEQLETEERMSDLSADIAHVSRQSAMSELAADLAHELNQPLSATSNYLSAARMLLERGDTSERAIELLRSAVDQTQRAGEIIRRLRAFMARGEVEMRAESVERTVRDAADLVQVGTAHFNIRMAFQLDPEVRFVFADRIQVQQVLVNLIRNAMQALRNSDRPDRLVTISSRKLDDQMVEIAVADNGPGIPTQILENMFTRFTTTKGGRGGMGIGLSISKRIIEAHGGALSAANQAEGGAVFRFTLPMIEGGHDQ